MHFARFVLFGLLLAGVVWPVAAGTGDDGRVVRISVELVQLDVAVTDKKGQSVSDLSAADFEVREDGQPREIVAVAYVRSGRPPVPPATSREPAALLSASAAAPRTLVFVVDDLGLSTESVAWTRQALRDTLGRLDPTDQVALVTTSHPPDTLSLSDDHARARAAAEALRFRPGSRDPLATLGSSRSGFAPLPGGYSRLGGGSFDDRNLQLILRSLGVVRDTVDAVRQVSGRKALILVSEGFWDFSSLNEARVYGVSSPLDRFYGEPYDVQEALRRLGDLAARASVVVYAVDPRGLVAAGLNVLDSAPPRSGPPGGWAAGMGGAGGVNDVLLARRTGLRHSQATLESLPDETGGLTLLDRNDLAEALGSVLRDLGSYYLVGFAPGTTSFSAEPRFHDVEVKVKRPGLDVRTRKGYYGVTDDQVASATP